MTEDKPKATLCPNCQQPAMRTGNKVTCEKCDAVYKITREGSATVQQLGPLEDHEQRIKILEGKISTDEPAPEPAPEPDDDDDDDDDDEPEPENDDADQEGEIFPR